MKRQRVLILGATGSVGVNTLDVLGRHPERYEVFALTAQSRIDELLHQCARWRPRYAAVPDGPPAHALRERLAAEGIDTEVVSGPQALCDLAPSLVERQVELVARDTQGIVTHGFGA